MNILAHIFMLSKMDDIPQTYINVDVTEIAKKIASELMKTPSKFGNRAIHAAVTRAVNEKADKIYDAIKQQVRAIARKKSKLRKGKDYNRKPTRFNRDRKRPRSQEHQQEHQQEQKHKKKMKLVDEDEKTEQHITRDLLHTLPELNYTSSELDHDLFKYITSEYNTPDHATIELDHVPPELDLFDPVSPMHASPEPDPLTFNESFDFDNYYRELIGI